MTVLNPGLYVEIFSNYGCLKKREKFVVLTNDVTQNFLERGSKTKYEKKYWKLGLWLG